MANFLVETYAPSPREAELETVICRAQHAAAAALRESLVVEHLSSSLLPEDEICFHVFEGTNAAITYVAEQAGIDIEQIVETVVERGGRRSGSAAEVFLAQITKQVRGDAARRRGLQ